MTAGMPALAISLKYLAWILGGKVDMLKHLAVLRADGWNRDGVGMRN